MLSYFDPWLGSTIVKVDGPSSGGWYAYEVVWEYRIRVRLQSGLKLILWLLTGIAVRYTDVRV